MENVRRTHYAFVWSAVGIFVCAAARAAEWSFQPTLESYFDHDSNRLLTTQPGAERSNEAAWLTLDAYLKRITETGDIELHPQYVGQHFIGDSDFDSNNGSLQFAADHRGEIFSYSATASYANRSTLQSELADTGIIDSHARQEAANGSVTLSDQFTERQRVGAQIVYADVKYPNGEQVGLIGYRHAGVSATYTFGFSTELAFSAIVFGGRESAPDIGYTSDDLGARIGWDWAVSPTSKLSASAGVSRTTFGSEQVYGSVWSVQAENHSERTRWSLSFTRDVVPNGVGFLTRRDELDLAVVRKMTARLDATFSVLAAQNEDVLFHLFETNRRYFTGTAALGWHATEQWLVTVQLRASEARYRDNPEPFDVANGWQTALKLLWTPNPSTASR